MSVSFDLLQSLSHAVETISLPTLLVVIWKASRYITKTEDRFQAAFKKLTGNDLAHIHAELQDVNEGQKAIVNELKELRGDIRLLMVKDR